MNNSFIVSIKSNSQDYEQIKSTWDFCFVFAKVHQTTENYKSNYSSTASTTYKAGKIRTLFAKKKKYFLRQL